MKNIERLRDNLWNIVFFTLLCIIAAFILALILSVNRDETVETVVGAAFISSIDDGGWNESHYKDLRKVCRELDLRLETEDNVKETAVSVDKAVTRLVKKGCNIIFLTSDGFDSRITNVTDSHPKVSFYTVSPDVKTGNVTSYLGRMYQIRYLCGMIAGKKTKTNILGFVGGIESTQVDRNVNAFYLGAKSVNPDVILNLRLTGSWFDNESEKKAANDLIDSGADVLTFHTSEPNTVDVAEERGVYSIGYGPVNKKYSDRFLTAALYNWDVIYNEILRDCIGGRSSTNGTYWRGATEGAVELYQFSPLVDKRIIARVGRIQNSYQDGWDVFSGEIISNTGEVMCNKDERISDASLFQDMRWFAKGVQLYE